MKTLLINCFLSLVAGWFFLFDRCLIVATKMPISGGTVVLLLLQVGIGACVFLFMNHAITDAAP